MINVKKYFEIFEISMNDIKNLTVDEINKRYKKLAKKYHPDVNKNDPHAEEKFKLLNEAKEYLIANLSVLKVNNSFGNIQHIKEKVIEVIVSLEDQYFKKYYTVKYTKRNICRNCMGNGCSQCNKQGYFIKEKSIDVPLREGLFVIDQLGDEYLINGRIYTTPILCYMRFMKHDSKRNYRRVGDDLVINKLLSFNEIIKLFSGENIEINIFDSEKITFNINNIDESTVIIPKRGFRNQTQPLISGSLVILIGIDSSKNSISQFEQFRKKEKL